MKYKQMIEGNLDKASDLLESTYQGIEKSHISAQEAMKRIAQAKKHILEVQQKISLNYDSAQ
tara:strand:- start:2646 stop:2831 length:186 start_codon:yes stop_codon:yes gene_type:complete